VLYVSEWLAGLPILDKSQNRHCQMNHQNINIDFHFHDLYAIEIKSNTPSLLNNGSVWRQQCPPWWHVKFWMLPWHIGITWLNAITIKDFSEPFCEGFIRFLPSGMRFWGISLLCTNVDKEVGFFYYFGLRFFRKTGSVYFSKGNREIFRELMVSSSLVCIGDWAAKLGNRVVQWAKPKYQVS